MLGENELRKESLIKFFKESFPITPEEGKLLSHHREQPLKYPISDKLKSYAERIDKLLDVSKKEIESRKLLKEFFPQSFIKKTTKKILEHQEIIPILKRESAIKRHQEAIKKLEEYKKFLKELQYLPHLYLPKQQIERAVLKLLPEGKITSKFRANLSKLKGRKIDTLDKAKKLGFLPEEDIRIILATHFEYVFRKCAIYDTIESLKQNKKVILSEKEAPEDWNKLVISQLDGYRVHPLLARAIEDFAISYNDGIIWRGYDAVNSLGKAIIFYNPIILPFWDIFQAYGAGSIKPWRPIYSAKLIINGLKDVINKGELYQESIKGGAYGTPKVGHYSPPMEETMKIVINQMDKKYPKWKKLIEKITGEKVSLKTATIIPSLYKTNRRLTWFLDRVLRTATLRHALNKGMSMEEAIDYTNNFHANYNIFTKRSKKWLNRIFLVPTYKVNMLINLPHKIMRNTGKLATDIIHGRKTTAQSRQYAFAIFRILGLIAGVLTFAAWRKYRLKEGYRLVKKLEKPYISKEGKIIKERVITLPGPFFEWPKVIRRIKEQKLAASYMYMAKIPQIGWSLARNRNWRGEKFFEEGAAPDVQRRQIIYRLLADYIAPIDRWEMMTDEETDAFDNIISIFGAATYKRGGTENRIIWQMKNKKNKLKTYISKPNISEDKKFKAILAFEIKIKKLQKELEKYIKDYY